MHWINIVLELHWLLNTRWQWHPVNSRWTWSVDNVMDVAFWTVSSLTSLQSSRLYFGLFNSPRCTPMMLAQNRRHLLNSAYPNRALQWAGASANTTWAQEWFYGDYWCTPFMWMTSRNVNWCTAVVVCYCSTIYHNAFFLQPDSRTTVHLIFVNATWCVFF